MTAWVYDIEVLPNVFTLVAQREDSDKQHVFEISYRKNDIKRLHKWFSYLYTNNHSMVGFNNMGYDYPVIHMLFNLPKNKGATYLTDAMYKKSKAIIYSGRNPKTKFDHMIWDNQCLVNQIDLYKIHHFDNQARRTSLKRLEFNMRMDSITEFDLPFDEPVTNDYDLDTLINYNKHDVTATMLFYKYSLSQIEFRREIESMVGESVMNFNDVKIGERYLLNRLVNTLGKDEFYYYENDKRQKYQSPRNVMPIKDIIFDYVKFKKPVFNEALEELKARKLYLIKGKFHWSKHDDYLEMYEKAKKDKELKQKYNNDNILCEHRGFVFEIGKGGLHGSLKGSHRYATSKRTIIDLDVTSYYPYTGIVNGLYPEHIGPEFCGEYESVAMQRKQHAKGTPENAMLKLSLNGVYGKTNSAWSEFYDPLYTAKTTINGQLMLLMLWEMLSDIEGIELIQANTDGITIEVDRKHQRSVGMACKQWERVSGLNLESAVYSNMWIRDGNNYLAEYTDGKIKQKGAYVYSSLFHDKNGDGDGTQWHKVHSMLVVQKAVEAELVHGMSASKYIVEHEDVYDFFLCTNVNRSCKLFIGDGVIPAIKKGGVTMVPAELGPLNRQIQRNSRYLISNSDEVLTKQMKPLRGGTHPRYIGINVGYGVSVHNDVKSDKASDYDIDYQFYIDEADKLLEPFR